MWEENWLRPKNQSAALSLRSPRTTPRIHPESSRRNKRQFQRSCVNRHDGHGVRDGGQQSVGLRRPKLYNHGHCNENAVELRGKYFGGLQVAEKLDWTSATQFAENRVCCRILWRENLDLWWSNVWKSNQGQIFKISFFFAEKYTF